MSTTTAEIDARAAGLGLFEKWLSIWVGGAILAGIALGNIAPGIFASLAAIEYASVNLVVAVLIWAMIFPMMVAVDFGAVRRVGDKPKGLIITLVVNWLIKPFTMAALGVLFFEVVFAGQGVGQAAGAQSVADREGDVIEPHHRADFVPQVVHQVLAAVFEHPFGQQRAATADDSDQAVLHEGQVLAQDAGVDREVVDPLFRLVQEGL